MFIKIIFRYVLISLFLALFIFPISSISFIKSSPYRIIATSRTYSTHLKSPLFDQLYNEEDESSTDSIHTDPPEIKPQTSDSIEWRNIVLNEIVKSKTRGTGVPVLSAESKMLLEDKIKQLRRQAHSNPRRNPRSPGKLWIIRPAKGEYCELLKRDTVRVEELVRNIRKYFTEDKLEILDIKVDVNMPLCEIIFEGFINDLFRPFYARGTILQDEIPDKFRVECPTIEKDERLNAKYGGRYAPGLLPRWDTQGILEEVVDAMDRPPDWAMKIAPINFMNALYLARQFDIQRVFFIRDTFNWPTRQRVQSAFEDGVDDYRHIIEEEYEMLQAEDRSYTIPEWMPPMKDPPSND